VQPTATRSPPACAISKRRSTGGPDTVLVDDEIVSIIRAQQRWVEGHLAEHAPPGTRPVYLFLADRMNRNADRHYPSSSLHTALDRLAHLLDIREHNPSRGAGVHAPTDATTHQQNES
jgi:hypothetical protein